MAETKQAMSPKKIFCMVASEHRVGTIKTFLRDCGRPFKTNAKKAQLLDILVQVEPNFSEEEQIDHAQWFRAHTPAEERSLQGLLPSEPEGTQFTYPRELRDTKSETLPQLLGKRSRVETRSGVAQESFSIRPSKKAKNLQSIHNPGSKGNLAIQSTYRAISSIATQAAPGKDHKECSACMETLSKDQFPDTLLTELCKHNSTTCKDCVSLSINTQIPELSWDHIQCLECSQVVSYETVKKFASKAAFVIYDRKYLLSVFSSVPQFTMCINPTCSSGQVHDGGENQPIMTCEACGFKMCANDKVPWHEGKSCIEYESSRAEHNAQVRASERMIARVAQICPGPGCGIPIIKSEGCSHMTCKKCGHEFCYLCLADFELIKREGNTGHNEDCKFHTSNLPLTRVHPAARRESQALRRAIHQSLAQNPEDEVSVVPSRTHDVARREEEADRRAMHLVPTLLRETRASGAVGISQVREDILRSSGETSVAATLTQNPPQTPTRTPHAYRRVSHVRRKSPTPEDANLPARNSLPLAFRRQPVSMNSQSQAEPPQRPQGRSLPSRPAPRAVESAPRSMRDLYTQ